MVQALLAAAKNEDAKIVRCFLEKNVHIIVEYLPNGKNVITHAIHDGLITLFQVSGY